MVSKKEWLIEKEIGFLSQLQDKEKFNHNANQTSINNIIIYTGVIWISLFVMGINFLFSVSILVGILLIITSFIIMSIGISKSKPHSKNLEKIENDFEDRELEIKKRYNKLGVDVKKIK